MSVLRDVEVTGYDWDGVLSTYPNIVPVEPYLIISGRTRKEPAIIIPDGMPKPFGIYTRLFGEVGDRNKAGMFKAGFIQASNRMRGFKIVKFYEDDPLQADMIREKNPDVEVIVV